MGGMHGDRLTGPMRECCWLLETTLIRITNGRDLVHRLKNSSPTRNSVFHVCPNVIGLAIDQRITHSGAQAHHRAAMFVKAVGTGVMTTAAKGWALVSVLSASFLPTAWDLACTKRWI